MFHTKQDLDRHVNEVFRNIRSENQKNLKCYQIGKLYYKFKDYKSAIKYINRYLLTTTNSAPAYRLLGDCYLGINSKIKALQSYKSSLELNAQQHDLVLEICKLLMDPEVSAVTPKPTYWLERAESLFTTNPIVFQLKEHLLKSNSDGKQDNAQLEKLIFSEINARPTDITVRIRLLNFYVDTDRLQLAYNYALKIEERNTFSNDIRWNDCLCNLVEAYEKATSDLSFDFSIKKILFFERRADLFMQEFQDEVKTLPECSSALFAFDQNLHAVSKIQVSMENSYFFAEFMKHMRAQLAFHLATLALKRAKKEYGIWPKAFRIASPLLLQASQNTMDLEGAWYSMWPGKSKMNREVQEWHKTATFRVSQAGHVLLAWSQSKGAKFLEKVSKFCGGKWQRHVYQDIFYSRDHQQAIDTSHFVNDPFFTSVPMHLLSETELNHYDEVSQSAYPDSLHHLVWLGLAYCNANGQLSHDFRCTTFPDLQFTIENLSLTGPETLNQLDVDAFLYTSVLCANSTAPSIISSDRPSRLPVSISEDLCSIAQADWWVGVYKTYKNQATDNIANLRLKIRKGIETVRAYGQHGLHLKLIVMLAKIFQERAAKNKNPGELNGLEERAYLYWSAAIPLLEKVDKNHRLRDVSNRLFDYRGKELTSNEIKNYLEDGKLFLACRLMKQGCHEEAIEAFQVLKSPYATFYQALIYEKLANEEVNHWPESITSENRSQHIILLTRARDAFYLTFDRLRCPSMDPNHPLSTQLQDHLDEIERQLAMIDPDSTLNRNGDAESDETDNAPVLSPEVEENTSACFNVYNANNFFSLKNHSTSRPLRHNVTDQHHNPRYEARPSPERLDVQLRQLVQANNVGLQAIVDQLKEMKSMVKIELKDLGCVTRDLLAEMKRWNDKAMPKRPTDSIKPEDFFELRDEDYEDLSQLSQQFSPYQNYTGQMPGTQGVSTVAYGTPGPSPMSSVSAVPTVASVNSTSPVIPSSDKILMPPLLCPASHSVPSLDSSLLFFPNMGYYPSRLPYGENQNVSDYRGRGIQKGAPFAKNPYRAPEPTMSLPTTNTHKPQPPNIVITSSDTLPAFTSGKVPVMSVTIPPQHIRGVTPSNVQKSNPNQAHPFQIRIPSQAQLVKESPTEKLNAIMPTTSLSTTPIQTTLLPDVKTTPTQQTTPPPKETTQINQKTQVSNIPKAKVHFPSSKENELSISRGELLHFIENEWKEQGAVIVKILLDENLGKARILVLKETPNEIYSEQIITPEISLENLKQNDKCWLWGARGKENRQKFCVRFNSFIESKHFQYSFEKAQKFVAGNAKNIIKKSDSQDMTPKKPTECKTCKTKLEIAEKCSACDNNAEPTEKTNLGGFTFFSSPIIQPPVMKLEKPKEASTKGKPKETPKPSPFSEFSFSPNAKTSSNADSKLGGIVEPFNFGNLISALNNPDPNSFKKDANFKGFEGQGSLVFGNDPKKNTPEPGKVSSTSEASKDDRDDADDDFVPTAEFTPVVKMPDLVDVKTGEENDKVLFSERAKLLRFDTKLKEWKERGVGDMKILLNEETGKVRLIMRREIILKVCCNHYMNENMDFTPMKKSENAVTWCAQDYSDGDLKAELLAIRFKTKALMLQFTKIIKDTQAKMRGGRLESEEEKEPRSDKSNELKPLSELPEFKPQAGSWECQTCLIRNNENFTKCASCESPKPGTDIASKESTQTITLGKGTLFPPSTTKFNFGIPQSTTMTSASAASAAPKFTFGIPQSTTNITPAATMSNFTFGFTNFGTPISTVTSSVSSPTFNTFGGRTPSNTATSSSGNPGPKFTFGPSSLNLTTSTTSASTPKLEVKSESAGPVCTQAPSFTLAGTPFRGISSSARTSATPSNSTPNMTNIFGGAPLKNPEAQASFTFSIPKQQEDKFKAGSIALPKFSFSSSFKTEGSDKFDFNLSHIKPAVQPGSSGTSPSSTEKAEDVASDESEGEPENDCKDAENIESAVPILEEVAIHTGEEDEDVLYEKRAKLYRYTDKEWKERGLGYVKILKHKTNAKIRLLMRRETILKVCLNHYLTADIDFTLREDQKSWQWAAADFSEDPTQVKYETFAMKFENPEAAQEFKRAIDDVLKKVTPSPSKLEFKEPTPAMKSFTFTVPDPSKTSDPAKTAQSAGSDDDILVLYENKVTPEEEEKAKNLQLPPNFYAYLQAPDCPGCPGCVQDDTSVHLEPKVFADSTSKPPSTFETKSWGSLNFGNTDSEGKSMFSFSGNQSSTFPKSISEASSQANYESTGETEEKSERGSKYEEGDYEDCAEDEDDDEDEDEDIEEEEVKEENEDVKYDEN